MFTVWVERLDKVEILVTSSGIGAAAWRLMTECLTQLNYSLSYLQYLSA
jgi:uridine phosphorylase